FAFSVPSTNMQTPLKRFHWVVLPQGMKNSPTICQQFVAHVLSPVRQQVPEVLIYHYMDDLLIAAESPQLMEKALALTTDAINKAGLCIAPEKIQKQPPWQYLGWRIRSQTIHPQTLKLHLLKGDPNLLSPRTVTQEAAEALQKVTDALQKKQASRYAPELPFCLILLNPAKQPYALIYQWDPSVSHPLLIIGWVFLPHQMTKTITTQHELFATLIIRARNHLFALARQDFMQICLPVVSLYLQWLLQNSDALQMALCDFTGQVTSHPHAHCLLTASFNLLAALKQSEVPLQALMVFTDGS
ncbi:POK25 protein, partial [Oriolus oriolus]|nr:POK25 protein [Oriolus oriolus]